MAKSKKILSIVAAALSACIFSSCSAASAQVTFKDYWFFNPNTTPDTVLEELTYKVKFEKSSSNGDEYELSYNTGTYTTKLTSQEIEGQKYYVYETKLTISGQYVYDTQIKDFDDEVTMYAQFMQNAKLTPVYSRKTIKSHTPTNNTALSVDSCYSLTDYTVETTYQQDATGGRSTLINNKTEKSSEFSFTLDGTYTCVDNEQLLLALRGLGQSSTAKLSVYSPFANQVQTIDVTPNSKEEGVEYKYDNGTQNGFEGVIETIPFTIAINSKNSGASQTIWIAQYNDQTNTHRNAILKMQTAVAYNLGTFTYTLTKATFA